MRNLTIEQEIELQNKLECALTFTSIKVDDNMSEYEGYLVDCVDELASLYNCDADDIEIRTDSLSELGYSISSQGESLYYLFYKGDVWKAFYVEKYANDSKNLGFVADVSFIQQIDIKL